MQLKALAFAALVLAVVVVATPLDDYVNKPDSNYAWYDTGIRINGSTWDGYLLNMTSQAWLTTDDWHFPDAPGTNLWWHYLLVVVPHNLVAARSDRAFVWITGGENHPNSIPKPDDEDSLVLATLCVNSGMVGGALFQIPNQPIIYNSENPPKERIEDAMIAYGWNEFIHDTTKTEWLARLPMTKAVVRAMDTITAYRAQSGQNIVQFGVAGASKRGWTTWTTAAVDKRVFAAIPIVMDELNFVRNIHHHYRAYGGWSFALEDYYAMNFTAHLDDPNVAALLAIVDPIVYAERLTMPKLVIDAAGDEFFLPDDEYYWWDQMPEPKHFLMVPNAEHSMATGVLEVLSSVSAWVNGVMDQDPIPQFDWVIDYAETGNITITVPPGAPQPENVTMWTANSAAGTGRRDFRLIAGYPKPGLQPVFWSKTALQPTTPGQWVALMPKPAEGWTGLFVDMQFPAKPTINGEKLPFEFTTQVSIIPNTFPFPDCTGEGCYGHLL